MPSYPTRRIALALMAFAPTMVAVAEESRGIFGLTVKVDSDGVFNPTLKSVLIQSVQSGMPAALAGIVAGDLILEVEGGKVAGAKASTMADRMNKKPGEQVTLKLRRANGEAYEVTLVAVPPRH
ncbi:PDZ domain-containing protein [Rubrivivax sp. A210]|uniref:PDZ domain-containing protein n=1 Tax=Rubrivivax sp. A210 TaxID=2772301 RepID=UPI001F3891BC|nr:PDZ domain-containing protein [Rubrivivax sp. A210]